MADRLVVIGGDAGGMAAASQARRLRPDIEIVALERGRWTSYSACGIPYLVGGDVAQLGDLVARLPQVFRDEHRIDVRTRHEAMAVDVEARTIEVRDHEHERTFSLGFDLLPIGTGGVPIRPDLPGMDDAHVHGVQNLEDAADLFDDVADVEITDVVVVGGGYIGLEMAEAFVKRGCRNVTVVERGQQVMGTLDPDVGARVTAALRREGVDVRLRLSVDGFEKGAVITDAGPIRADLVVLGLGVAPNTALARDAGIATTSAAGTPPSRASSVPPSRRSVISRSAAPA